MPINPWITRALISVAGSVVTTTAIVTTAKQPKKRKKKKRKGKGKDGVKVEEEVPRSMGAQAAHDYRVGHDGGMTGGEFVDSVKGIGGKVRTGMSWVGAGLFGTNRGGPPPEEGDGARKRPRKGKKRRRRRGPPPKGKRRRPRPKDKGDFAAIRDEVAKAAGRKVVKGAADKIGAGEMYENIATGAEKVKEQTQRLAEGLRDQIPEDLGEKVGDVLENTGNTVKTWAEKARESIKDAFGDGVDWSTAQSTKEGVEALEERVDQQLADVARWIDGDKVEDVVDAELIDAELIEEEVDEEVFEAKVDEDPPPR